MCTANNNSWKGTTYSQNFLFDQQSGCDALIKAGTFFNLTASCYNMMKVCVCSSANN